MINDKTSTTVLLATCLKTASLDGSSLANTLLAISCSEQDVSNSTESATTIAS